MDLPNLLLLVIEEKVINLLLLVIEENVVDLVMLAVTILGGHHPQCSFH